MKYRIGQRVKLRRDNPIGIGVKEQTGTIVETFWNKIDYYDYIVRFDDGSTEGFKESALMQPVKTLSK